MLVRFRSRIGLRDRIWPGAELDVAPIASLHGDLLPHVSGGQSLALWRRLDGLLCLSLAEDPSGQHLGVIHGPGREGRRRGPTVHHLRVQ